jgi:SAM-dependent methyltransferase
MNKSIKLPFTYSDIVEEIVKHTSLSREEVEHKVWMQALEPGWNVLQDVARFGVTPHSSNERMDLLYEKGDGFIFETLVFWAKPERFRWTLNALERINIYASERNATNEDISILVFGDGTGNDSLFLASHGFQIDYFDIPGSKTFHFAMHRFESYGFLGKSIHPISDYRRCFDRAYDVVISFEVLEHLPQPLKTIQDISLMLKVGGIALITEDFDDIVDRLPTHLKTNLKFVGKTPFLFLKNKMFLSWYSQQPLFKPMEFVKLTNVSIADWLHLARDFHVRSNYIARYLRKLANKILKIAYLSI